MTKFEFAGITGTVAAGIEDTFENVYDNDTEQIFDQKEIRTHTDEDFEFKYYYAVQVLNMYEATGDSEDEGNVVVELHMVIHPDSLSEKHLKDLVDSMGVDSKEDLMTSDFTSYGNTVTIGTELLTFRDESYFDDEIINSTVVAAFSAAEGIDGMRGFFLDRPWNRVGTTGWDTVLYNIGMQEKLFNF